MEKENKHIKHTYKEDDIEVVIEIPSINIVRDKDKIDEIKTIMNNELLLQISK